MYINDWKESGFFGMVADFAGVYITKQAFDSEESPYTNKELWMKNKKEMQAALNDEDYQGLEVLLASYTYEDYTGSAFVLFKKDGKLWEVNASHCSCYGLEGQWDPEETTPEALLVRKWDESEGVTSEDVKAALQRGGYSA